MINVINMINMRNTKIKTVVMNDRGVIVIPEEIRQDLGLEGKVNLILIESGNEIIINYFTWTLRGRAAQFISFCFVINPWTCFGSQIEKRVSVNCNILTKRIIN